MLDVSVLEVSVLEVSVLDVSVLDVSVLEVSVLEVSMLEPDSRAATRSNDIRSSRERRRSARGHGESEGSEFGTKCRGG